MKYKIGDILISSLGNYYVVVATTKKQCTCYNVSINKDLTWEKYVIETHFTFFSDTMSDVPSSN